MSPTDATNRKQHRGGWSDPGENKLATSSVHKCILAMSPQVLRKAIFQTYNLFTGCLHHVTTNQRRVMSTCEEDKEPSLTGELIMYHLHSMEMIPRHSSEINYQYEAAQPNVGSCLSQANKSFDITMYIRLF